MESRIPAQSYDSVSEFADDLADYSTIPGESAPEQITSTNEELYSFFNFILHLDDYTLGALSEIISPQTTKSKRINVAELARIRGISRQGMHRKMIDIARKTPALASMLRCTLIKLRKAKKDFWDKSVKNKAYSQYVHPDLF